MTGPFPASARAAQGPKLKPVREPNRRAQLGATVSLLVSAHFMSLQFLKGFFVVLTFGSFI